MLRLTGRGSGRVFRVKGQGAAGLCKQDNVGGGGGGDKEDEHGPEGVTWGGQTAPTLRPLLNFPGFPEASLLPCILE